MPGAGGSGKRGNKCTVHSVNEKDKKIRQRRKKKREEWTLKKTKTKIDDNKKQNKTQNKHWK